MACSQCGTGGADGICSMCYGDIDYGSDGFYRDYMDEWQRQHFDRQQEEQGYMCDWIVSDFLEDKITEDEACYYLNANNMDWTRLEAFCLNYIDRLRD